MGSFTGLCAPRARMDHRTDIMLKSTLSRVDVGVCGISVCKGHFDGLSEGHGLLGSSLLCVTEVSGSPYNPYCIWVAPSSHKGTGGTLGFGLYFDSRG